VDPVVFQAGNFAAIRVLRGLLVLRAAAFQQHDIFAEAQQFRGQQNARRARTDDTDIRLGHRVRPGVKQIFDHTAILIAGPEEPSESAALVR
jgi:hypothetical protein